MASSFRLKRKLFGEYGEAALKALREGKAAGLQGKDLQEWVRVNSGSTYATTSGINSIGGIQARPGTNLADTTNNVVKNRNTNWQVTVPKNTPKYTPATSGSNITTGGNMISLTGNTNANYGQSYKGSADKAFKNVTSQQSNIIQSQAKQAAERAKNLANPGQAAAQAMKNKVGVMQGMKNTWGKMGNVGKVGIGAAAIGGGYFLGKGLGLWGNNK